MSGARVPRGAVRSALITAIGAAIQAVLSLVGPNSIPLPTGVRVTILELPTILAAVLGGPVAGILVGLVFGALSFARATTPLFMNALVAVGPRLLIGLFAYAAYLAAAGLNRVVALALAGAIGALANSGLVLLLAARLPGPNGAGDLSATDALTVLRATAPSEMAAAAVITVAVGVVARRIEVSRAGRDGRRRRR